MKNENGFGRVIKAESWSYLDLDIEDDNQLDKPRTLIKILMNKADGIRLVAGDMVELKIVNNEVHTNEQRNKK